MSSMLVMDGAPGERAWGCEPLDAGVCVGLPQSKVVPVCPVGAVEALTLAGRGGAAVTRDGVLDREGEAVAGRGELEDDGEELAAREGHGGVQHDGVVSRCRERPRFARRLRPARRPVGRASRVDVKLIGRVWSVEVRAHGRERLGHLRDEHVGAPAGVSDAVAEVADPPERVVLVDRGVVIRGGGIETRAPVRSPAVRVVVGEPEVARRPPSPSPSCS